MVTNANNILLGLLEELNKRCFSAGCLDCKLEEASGHGEHCL
jgi:hypothetical protein